MLIMFHCCRPLSPRLYRSFFSFLFLFLCSMEKPHLFPRQHTVQKTGRVRRQTSFRILRCNEAVVKGLGYRWHDGGSRQRYYRSRGGKRQPEFTPRLALPPLATTRHARLASPLVFIMSQMPFLLCCASVAIWNRQIHSHRHHHCRRFYILIHRHQRLRHAYYHHL